MDNRPLLKIGFDGHYVVYLWERGGEIPPALPDSFLSIVGFLAGVTKNDTNFETTPYFSRCFIPKKGDSDEKDCLNSWI